MEALLTIDDALPANSRVLLVSPYWLSAGDIQANITAERKGEEMKGKGRGGEIEGEKRRIKEKMKKGEEEKRRKRKKEKKKEIEEWSGK